MNTELLGESDFLSSTSNNGLMKVKQIFIFPPNETSWEKANFLWYVGTNSFETPRSFAFLSGYTRLVLRLSGDQLLINHDNSAHSHIVKKVCQNETFHFHVIFMFISFRILSMNLLVIGHLLVMLAVLVKIFM